MTELNLPKFKLPRLTSKKLPFHVIEQWNEKNFRLLAKAGFKERCRNDATRRPAATRFVLR